MKLNYGSLIVALLLIPIVVIHAWGAPWTALRIAGLAIAIPSFMLVVLARIQLGRAFSVRAKASALVTTGLYSRIRNPIYIFGSLCVAGGILWLDRPWLLLGFVVLIPMQIIRSRSEQKVLAKEFGQSYLDYKQSTWF